ncbi:hypothetical protein RJ640_012237 [Escallonia rubra]|uniref:Disease resistance R13L4/SHOC-2-like LRR domain-containing protein n=1 Tax=Escallonia rubra TaxID=112253 RepID=A0AA88U4B3_9ASTE|nr:hypothetical protein RJ640_012237 [Escallonia rubra]
MLANFTCLRALVLINHAMEELPNSIGKLKHLRYLDISKTNVKTLPVSINKLYNLQTLRVKYLIGLLVKFGNWIHSRHFIFEYGGKTRDYKGCQIKDLEGMNSLKGRENHRRSQKANLLKKSHNNALQFHWSGEEGENTNKVVSEEGNTGLTNVKRIGAEFYGHNAEVATSSGRGISAGGAMFPALITLHLVELGGLEQWLEALHPSPFVKVFPCLEELELTGLYKLSMCQINTNSPFNLSPPPSRKTDSLGRLPCHRMARISSLENMLRISSNSLVAMASQLSEAEEREHAFTSRGR